MRSNSSRGLAAVVALALAGLSALGASAASASPINSVSIAQTNPGATATQDLQFLVTRTGGCLVINGYARTYVYPTGESSDVGPSGVALDLNTIEQTAAFTVPAIGEGNSLRVTVYAALDCDGEELTTEIDVTPAPSTPPPPATPTPSLDLSLGTVGSFGAPNPYEPFSFNVNGLDFGAACVTTPPTVTWESTFTYGQGFPIVIDHDGTLASPQVAGNTHTYSYTQAAVGNFGSYTFTVQATGGCLDATVLTDSMTFSMSAVPDGWTPPPGPDPDPSDDPSEEEPEEQPSDEPAETPRDLDLTLNLAIGSQVEGAPGTVTSEGLEEGAAYDLVVRSTPQTLGVGAVPAGGVVTRTVTLPKLEAGWHSLTFTSTWATGGAAIARVWFQVSASGTLLATSATAPGLANTGSANTGSTLFFGSLALTTGLALLAWRRRPTGPLAEPLFR